MKKDFEAPELLIISFSNDDVIMTSDGYRDPYDDYDEYDD